MASKLIVSKQLKGKNAGSKVFSRRVFASSEMSDATFQTKNLPTKSQSIKMIQGSASGLRKSVEVAATLLSQSMTGLTSS